MNDEELQYIYPYPDKVREDFEGLFVGATPQNRIYIIGMICVIISAVLLVAYIFTFNILLIAAAVVFAFGGLKTVKTHLGSEHLCEIAAYETYIELAYFSEADNSVERISLPYTAIVSCKLSTDKYNCATLRYKKEHSGIEVAAQKLYDGSEKKVKKNGRFFFRLNEFSPEQEFFLYIADKLFHTQNDRKEIVRRFGTLETYHAKYIEEEVE